MTKNNLKYKLFMLCVVILIIASFITACPNNQPQQKSDSGVTKATVDVKTDENGMTIEQVNYRDRIKRDVDLGAIKHLYVISSYSGDVLEYSTVKGKVTSGGKRISPKTVVGANGDTTAYNYYVQLGGKTYITNEVMDEYGMYGDSANYFYWFDSQGNYHQYFPSGGTYVHISDRPLKPRKAIVTFEQVTGE